eukprot:m.109462 g.109462  ORF g.109462 m.109462 type:complete len:617 (-) comp14308_c0_seq1:117-1967(-)
MAAAPMRHRFEVDSLLAQILPDSCFSASSSKDQEHSAPWKARMHHHGGWRAGADDTEPFLQVDMERPRLLLKIGLQGQGGSDCWATSLKLDSSFDGQTWTTYGRTAERECIVFPGNMNDEGTMEHTLPAPLFCRFVRFRIISWFATSPGLRVELCARDVGVPVGIADGTLPTTALSASSQRNAVLGAGAARLGGPEAWQARDNDDKQFLDVDLGRLRMLGAILIQGRNTRNGQWIERFSLMTRWSDTADWSPVAGPDGTTSVFEGNSDKQSIVAHLLPLLVPTRYVRVIPLAWHDAISARIELIATDIGVPCGIASGAIPDAALTATSFFDDASTPSRARLGGKGAWIAKSERGQHLQVDLGEMVQVTGVVTQGCRSNFDYWIESFNLETSLDLKVWTPYKAPADIGAPSPALLTGLLPGNRDTDTPVCTVLLAPPVARAVRIRPVTTHRRHALRLELYTMPLGRPVGIERGEGVLTAPQLALSSVDQSNPDFARLNDTRGPGWVNPNQSPSEYLQVDLTRERRLTALLIQGCPAAWISRLHLTLSNDGNIWLPYTESLGLVASFSACTDEDSVLPIVLYTQPVARFIRIHPTLWHHWIAARVEFLEAVPGKQPRA